MYFCPQTLVHNTTHTRIYSSILKVIIVLLDLPHTPKSNSIKKVKMLNYRIYEDTHLNSEMNLLASKRISTMLLIKAKKGAAGIAHTNRVTKPNWITVEKDMHYAK